MALILFFLGVKTLRKFTLIILAMALVGCGSLEVSQMSSDQNTEDVLLVINGGNSTCQNVENLLYEATPIGMGMWNEFQDIKNNVLSRNISFHYMVSCYESTNPTVHYISSESPNTVNSVEFDEYLSTLNSMVSNYPNAKKFFQVTLRGWLVLKTAIQADYEIDMVYSNDPISRVNCSFNTPGGCTERPSDITTAEYESISQKSEIFSNYYQTKTFYLHSSEISEADSNVKLSLGHTSMDDAEVFWTDFGDKVLTFL